MNIAIFTDTFYPDINGVARTLKRFTDYLDLQQIPYKLFAPDSQTKEYVSSHIHRFKSLPFFLYPECRVALPNLLRKKTASNGMGREEICIITKMGSDF